MRNCHEHTAQIIFHPHILFPRKDLGEGAEQILPFERGPRWMMSRIGWRLLRLEGVRSLRYL
jgi:hypothetical protein